ncbi:hypothetical protein [Kitasatospora sp. NPDC057500]|uniref:hypothetical protein n=1 Tax=Kitasatospora sp. NPDC057500 TaxID=3346151 RepID=UPI0036BE142D
MLRIPRFVVDLAERTGATAGEAGLSYLIVELGNLPLWWVPLLTPTFAAAKGWLARFVGRPDTASLLSARRDPASRQ